MESPLKVVIVGAGIGGLACAIAARLQGLDVVVLERAQQLTPIGAGIQIPPNASRIWRQYGLLDRLKEFAVVSEAMVLRRWQNGDLLCSRSIGEKLNKDWPWLVIHRADYQKVLAEEADRLGVRLMLQADVEDVDFESTHVSLKDGSNVYGDVIIGADGLWSTMRSRILGHESPPQPTGDLAYRGTFPLATLQALQDPTVDELCRQNIVSMWIGPDSHAVFYPVRHGNEFNLVMTRPDDLPPNVKTKAGDLQQMMEVFRDWDPLLTKILTAFPSVLKWKMLHHDELSFWTKNNITLLGDACHPSLPYQAQGAAMAVEDGAILATLLGCYHRAPTLRPSIAKTLGLYEDLQKMLTTTLHLGSLANQHLYHLDDGAEQEERDKILREARWETLPADENEPFIWIDVRYQKEVLDRDAIADAERRWEEVIVERSAEHELNV